MVLTIITAIITPIENNLLKKIEIVDSSAIISAFILTFLSIIGLVFFIRASVKDRTQQIQLIATESETDLLNKIQAYFESRAYQIVSVEPSKQQLAFKGFVQPSWFLAIFLSFLGGLGLFCVVLVLFLFYPTASDLWWLLILLAPLAGLFYWRKAGRWEQVLLAIKSTPDNSNLITVTAHRDELNQLQQNLSLQIANTN